MPESPASQPDVLLVSDDAALFAALSRAKPRGVILARAESCAEGEHGPLARASPVSHGRDAHAPQPSAPNCTSGHCWIDLDGAVSCEPGHARRGVYFYSKLPNDGRPLPPGLFIRKPCDPDTAATLWSAVEAGRGTKLPDEADESQPLPGWIARLHAIDLRELTGRLVNELPGRLGYVEGSLYLHDAPAQVLTLAQANSRRPVELAVSMAAAGASLMAAAARTRTLIRTDDAAAARRELGVVPDAWRDDPDSGLLVAPLVDGDWLWGVLNCSGRVGEAPPAAVVDAALRFAARALRHACEIDRARLEARVDALTGLYNYRWMAEALSREALRAQRYGTALSVLMIDLDGLKAVNDRLGHLAGDALLRHTAARIRAALRQIDSAARSGGDEFVVLLPATTLAGGKAVAQRLLAGIGEGSATCGEAGLCVSVSIGVAEWQPGWTVERLLQAADQALYEAKRAGRGRVECQAP